MSKYQVEVETIIKAPVEKVWRIMTDINAYPQWNNFIRKIESPSGIPSEGTLMKFSVELKKGKLTSSSELVKKLSPPLENKGVLDAVWIYDFAGPLHNIGMVRATRIQKLTQTAEGHTHYYTCEKFSGWGKIFLPLKNVRKGFNIHATDLKSYCEK